MKILPYFFLFAAARAQGGVVGVIPAAGLVYTPDLDTSVVHANRVGERIIYGVSEHGAQTGIGSVLQGIIRIPYAARSVAAPARTVLSSPLIYEPALFVAE